MSEIAPRPDFIIQVLLYAFPLLYNPVLSLCFPAGVQASQIIPSLHKSSKQRSALGSNFRLGQFRPKYVDARRNIAPDLLWRQNFSRCAFRYSIPIVFITCPPPFPPSTPSHILSPPISLALPSFSGNCLFFSIETVHGGCNVTVRPYGFLLAFLSALFSVRPIEGLLPARTKIPVRKFRSDVASASATKLDINLQRFAPRCPPPPRLRILLCPRDPFFSRVSTWCPISLSKLRSRIRL